MSKYYDIGSIRQHFILARPYHLSELDTDYFENSDFEWRLKARKLQARRWRKIKHQKV